MAKNILNKLLDKRITQLKAKAKTKTLTAATPTVDDPTLQTWIKEVSSTVKDIASSGVRRSDLVRAGIATITNGELQNALSPPEEVNLTVPAAVLNLTASGAYSSNTLTWETRPSKFFGQNNIYRSDVDDFGTATHIGSTLGDVYTDYVGNNIKAYYWVRTISKFGVEGELSPSVYAETAIDVGYVLQQLEGHITLSQLDQILRGEISSISDIANGLQEEARLRVLELAALADQLRQESIDKAQEIQDRIDGVNNQIQQQIVGLNDGITTEINSRLDAEQQIINALEAYKLSNDNAVAAVINKVDIATSTNEVQALAISGLQANFETVSEELSVKADISNLTLAENKIAEVDGKVIAATENITALGTRMGTVEGAVSTKLEASALNDYYTKSESDDKATTIAAGEISKYDANLVIGGVNLIPNSFDVPQWSNHGEVWPLDVDVINGVRRIRRIGGTEPTVMSNYTGVFVDLPVGTTYTISVKVRPIGSDYSLSFYGNDTSIKLCKADQWTTIQATRTITNQPERVAGLISYAVQQGIWIEVKEWQAEIGNKATSWSPSPADVQGAINANANAIQTTNAEVSRINGEVVSTANSVNNLTSSVGLLQGSINEVRQTVTNNQESTNTLVTSLKSGMADADDLSMMMRNATVLFEDLSFKNGWNGVDVYNNYVNGALAVNFTDKLPDNPVAATRQLQFIHNGGVTNPGLGGFHQTTSSRPNSVFIIKFVAKLPVGYDFNLAANSYGDGSNGYFIGSSEGTGKFKTYHAVYRCGATGSFSTVGFVYANGQQHPTPENPLIWYLASSTVYDCLDSKVVPDSVVNGIAEAKSIASTAVNKAEASAVMAQNLQAALDNTNADISNNYYTKSQADTATAGHISSYDANLVIGGVNTYDNETTHIYGLVGNPQVPYRNSGDTPNGFYLIGDSTGQSAIRLAGVITEAGWWTISFYIKGSQSVPVGFKIDIVDGAEYLVRTTADNTWKYVQYSSYVSYVDSDHHFIDFSEIGWAYIFLKDIKVERGRKATAWTPSNRHVLDSLIANATAIQSTKAEVLRIDGVVTSQASQIVTLESSKSAIENGGIAGNNEYIVDLRDPAYNRDLYYPVLLSAFSTEYRQTIRVSATLDGVSVPPWASHGGGFSLNAQFQMGGSGWGTVDPEIVTDNFRHEWTHGGISPLDEINQIISSSQPFFYVRGGGYYRLSKPVNRSVQVCVPNGSVSGYHGYTLYPRPYQESTVPKSINQGLNQQNVKLQQTNTVLNGVKAVSTVTVDNNGVMSGYGLISELANGQVRSSFGVNADTFYIGSPNNNKKPFIHRNDWSQINGVWVPAGTYIDTALIANATISNAQVGNLSADKITAGNIAADRMKANIVAAVSGQFTSLSSISATIGVLRTATSGARTEIRDNLIEVYDDNNRLRVRMGVW